MLKKCASRIYMVLIFAFLYLPIIVLIALSFNDSRSKVKWAPAVRCGRSRREKRARHCIFRKYILSLRL